MTPEEHAIVAQALGRVVEDFCGPYVGHRDCDAIAAAIRALKDKRC